jgi:Uma2 family endonuclease
MTGWSNFGPTLADAELRTQRRGSYDMGMPAAFSKWTVDLLDALPESSERFELVDGELFVTPAPGIPHQRAVIHLASPLVDYAMRVGGCETVISPSDVWREPRQENRVQPDIYIVRLRDGTLPPYPFHLRELLLAIEVASPGRPLLDYRVKRALYEREGVAEYWVVNLDERSVTRWRGRGDSGEVLTGRIEWRANATVEPFALDLPSYFSLVLR